MRVPCWARPPRHVSFADFLMTAILTVCRVSKSHVVALLARANSYLPLPPSTGPAVPLPARAESLCPTSTHASVGLPAKKTPSLPLDVPANQWPFPETRTRSAPLLAQPLSSGPLYSCICAHTKAGGGVPATCVFCFTTCCEDYWSLCYPQRLGTVLEASQVSCESLSDHLWAK